MYGPEFRNWMDSLKPGDTVGVVGPSIGVQYEEAPVSRLTKTLVIVEWIRPDGAHIDRQFRKRDGMPPGEFQCHRSHIVKPTQEWRDRQENRKLRDQITEKYSRMRFSELKLTTLHRVLDTLIECEAELKEKA